MFTVYLLYSERFDRYYVGHTQDLDERLKVHNSGQNVSTKPYRPWAVVGKILKPTKAEAYALEQKLKHLSKARKKVFINKYCNHQSP